MSIGSQQLHCLSAIAVVVVGLRGRFVTNWFSLITWCIRIMLLASPSAVTYWFVGVWVKCVFQLMFIARWLTNRLSNANWDVSFRNDRWHFKWGIWGFWIQVILKFVLNEEELIKMKRFYCKDPMNRQYQYYQSLHFWITSLWWWTWSEISHNIFSILSLPQFTFAPFIFEISGFTL